MKQFFKVGMRTFKTAFCVLICLVIYKIFNLISLSIPDKQLLDVLNSAVLKGSPSFACIAAVICMQDDIEYTKKVAISRIIGAVVGGFTAIIFSDIDKLILSGKLNIVFAIIGVILIICFCNYIDNPISVSISVITFLIIFIGTDVSNPTNFAINRIVGTLIGTASSYFVNKIVCPPPSTDENDENNNTKRS